MAESEHGVCSDSKESRATVDLREVREDAGEGSKGGGDGGDRGKVHSHMALKPGAEKGAGKHAIREMGDIRKVKSM